MKLSDYRPHHAVRFLDSLAPKMAANSLMHVRALMSAIFSHAISDGRIDVNPIRDAKRRVEAKPSKPTPHYTNEEMAAILKVLTGQPQAQIALSLGFHAGLRTAEISGLQWSDISEDWNTITIRRSVWRTTSAPCKTDASQAPIPLMEPLRSMLRDFKATETILAPEQHVLVNSVMHPLNLSALAWRVIRPALKERGLLWKGFYAGRRGAGTRLYAINPQAAQGMLRHASLKTTEAFYVKTISSATLEGMKRMEAEYSEARDKQETVQ